MRAPFTATLLVLAFALVAVAGLGAVVMALRAAAADRSVVRTLEAGQAAAIFLSDLQDAETGQRGFLLTGDQAYLEPFNRAAVSTPRTLTELRRLTAGSPAQQARVRQLGPLSNAKLAELAQTVDLERKGRRQQALAIVMSGRGRELMRQVRVLVRAITDDQRVLLVDRERKAAMSQLGLLAFIFASLIGAAALAGFLALQSRRAFADLSIRTAELEVEGRRRRDTEETLRQVQKIESIGQLAGGVAHDFNNLLTVVLGNLDTIERRLAKVVAGEDARDLVASLTKSLAFAQQGGRSAAVLTQRLLAFSRRQALTPSRVDINRLVTGMAELLRRTLGETVELEAILAAGLWPSFTDANQLENALLNLCVNARHAMPEGGRLTIETANTYLDDRYAGQFGDVAPGQYVLLSVTDTGVGMAPEILDRVFEPFFTTKTEGVGSGLGLAMVHGFVKQSGGHVRIYSEVGDGTTVKIYLPRTLEAPPPSAPQAVPPPEIATPRAAPGEVVLLVEDNPEVLEYARATLQELGYVVLEAADAAEALRLIDQDRRVDLVFTDVVLPGLDGRALADRIIEKRGPIPILFTTGYSRNAIIHNGRLDPGVSLLTKPYTQRALALKLRELLDARSSKASPD